MEIELFEQKHNFLNFKDEDLSKLEYMGFFAGYRMIER